MYNSVENWKSFNPYIKDVQYRNELSVMSIKDFHITEIFSYTPFPRGFPTAEKLLK